MKKKRDNVKLISRRDFLKRIGLTGAGVAASSLFFPDLMAVPEDVLDRAARGPGIESWVNTVCGQCYGGCGIMVRLIDGIPVYIKGNPNYPVNWGGVCPMAHTAMEVLFNPDRVRGPLIQGNESKGSGRFETAEWNSVLSTLTGRLKALIAKGDSHRIAMISGEASPLARSLSEHWMKAVGSANYYEDERLAALENSIGALLSHGIDESPAYDLENSKYILNFGSNFLEEGKSPVYYQKIFGRLRSVSKETRATLVHIDSRLNLTGSSSDRWVPINPGTYGALALGIAHVLIADELYDKNFVDNHCHGFDPFKDDKGVEHRGFKALVRSKYYPEKVADITGVPAETIIKMGEEFGTQKPALALGDDASKYTVNGGFTQWAIYCLNALVGNIQKKGGVYFTPIVPAFKFPELTPGPQTVSSLSLPKVGAAASNSPLFGDVPVAHFAATVASGNKGLIDTLIIIDANPLFHSRQKEVMVKALEKIENVVYIGTFKDETALYANMILPAHSFLEKTDVSGPIPGLMSGHIGIQQPVTKPLFDTRQPGDILIETGKSLLGADAFPWKNYNELVNKRFEVIYTSGFGSIISESVDTEWDRYLKERGWKFQQYETFDSFYQLLVKNGGIWSSTDPARSARDLYHTASEKFEFYSSTLRQRLEGRVSARGIVGGDETAMPHFEVPAAAGLPGKFPLILTASQLLTNRDGKGASQPSMLEMAGIQVGRHWKSWLEINPATAKTYGLKDRKMAWIESARGRIKAEVRFFQGILPGVVHVHLGFGHTSYGRFGTGIGANAVDLVENTFDSLTPAPALNGTRVHVSPVDN
jgi:anaerobic selenocysteine-containing dehydrogenase